jgi:fumarylacetoacetase
VSPTWVEDVPADSPFGLHNLPYGVFSTPDDSTHRIGVAFGAYVLAAGARRGPPARPRTCSTRRRSTP